MKKIVLLNSYFANAKPNYLDFYISSCAFNKTIDFVFFTNLNLEYNYPNIKIVKMEFEEFAGIIKNRISNGLKERGIWDEVRIPSPYKLCDFKVCLGYCLSEYIEGYDFWGGFDIDLIYGDIRAFVKEDILNKYDKIYEHGHFSLIRNNKECNEMFFENYEKSFKYVLMSDFNTFFEEIYEKPWMPAGGVNCRFDEKNKLYKSRNDFCDISFKYHNLLDLKNVAKTNKVVILFDKGKLYRCVEYKKAVLKEEILYSHFQKRNLSCNTENLSYFYVDNDSLNGVPQNEIDMFRNVRKIDFITYRYFKFRYLDYFKRRREGALNKK